MKKGRPRTFTGGTMCRGGGKGGLMGGGVKWGWA